MSAVSPTLISVPAAIDEPPALTIMRMDGCQRIDVARENQKGMNERQTLNIPFAFSLASEKHLSLPSCKGKPDLKFNFGLFRKDRLRPDFPWQNCMNEFKMIF
jgi:hypothetical protein